MSKKIKVCECCGAKMVSYRHSLNIGLVKGLIALSKAKDYKSHISKLGLTYNQQCNFQKLRYWGLVNRVDKAGNWALTYLGVEFVNSGKEVPKSVYSYRGETTDTPDEEIDKIELVKVDSFVPVNYDKREDYIENANSNSNDLHNNLPLFA